MSPARLLAAVAVVAVLPVSATAAVTCSVARLELCDAFEGK